MDLNSVCISGRLTRTPELRSTETGLLILHMSVAVNERVKRDGKWTDHPNYIDVTVFGSKAEWLSGLEKGAQVAVQGRLKQERWEGRDGKRSKVVVIADRVSATRQKDLPVEEVEDIDKLLGDEEVPF